MSNYSRKVGEMTYDGLISDVTPKTEVRAGTICKLDSAATLARGTVLEKSSDGKLYVLGTNAGGTVTEDFNGDGSTKSFTLSATVKPLQVSVKVGTTATAVTYDAQSGVVTFATAPDAGTKNVHVSYDKPAANVPDCILCDDTEVGTESDVAAAVYTAGCFDPDKVTVKSGYTMTESDKDALRKYGIVFKAAQK